MDQDAARVLPAAAVPELTRWRGLRTTVACAYGAVLLWYCIAHGPPANVLLLTVVAVGGLLITTIGRGWRNVLRVGADWAPFIAVIVAYNQTRKAADDLGIGVHERDIVGWERWTFGGEPTIWLQHHLFNPTHVYWYDALLTLVYTSHFVATPVLAAVLWLRDRAHWLRYIARVVALSVAGLVTYIAFPEAPPWMAARDGLTAPVERLSARGWIWLHLGNVHDLLAEAQSGGSNPVAAMPSLHFAMAVLVATAIAQRVRTQWRWLLALYPAAMGFALVYLGEHWVLDLAAGLAYALGVHWLLAWLERRRTRRRALNVRRAAPMEQLEPIGG